MAGNIRRRLERLERQLAAEASAWDRMIPLTDVERYQTAMHVLVHAQARGWEAVPVVAEQIRAFAEALEAANPDLVALADDFWRRGWPHLEPLIREAFTKA